MAVREPIADAAALQRAPAGLIAAFKVLARQVAADGVTLNSVLPGTDRHRPRLRLARVARGGRGERAGDVPVGRLGTVEELAAAAVFLCSAPRELHHGHDAAGRRRRDAERVACSRRTGR